MNNYTYLTQVMRPARPQFMRATLPGQIDCVLTRNGTFTTNDLCLAVTSCGYRWGFDTTGHVCTRIQGGTFPSQTDCELGQTAPLLLPNAALQALGGFRTNLATIVQVNCITVDVVGGYVYVAGNFSGFGASQTPCVVAQYNMSTRTWADAGNAAASFDGTSIYSMLLLPNRSLVVTGDFTSIGPSTTSSGPWAVFNPSSQTWAEMPGTFPFATTNVDHSRIFASVMDKSGSRIFLAGQPPGTQLGTSIAMLLIYDVAMGVYMQVDTSNATRTSPEAMCLDQTEENLYINYMVSPAKSQAQVAVYNIANNTLATIGTGGPTKIRGMAVLLRDNVYYIAMAGVGSVLYDAATKSFINLARAMTGLPAIDFRAMYVDYYNNLYLGSFDGARLYCLPSNSTVWVSPDGGVGDESGQGLADGSGVLAITGSGNAVNDAASANTLWIGGTFETSNNGVPMSGFAVLVNANLVSQQAA